MAGSGDPTDVVESMSNWMHVPLAYQYIRDWAIRFGMRGLTVHFGKSPPLSKLASDAELVEVVAAYEDIARRGDTRGITAWCMSVKPETAANEAKEQIRGLLLLFERLAEFGIEPFTDERVRFVAPGSATFDWDVLPPPLHQWEPWLRKFENLRTEADLFCYTQDASEDQIHELSVLKELQDRDGQSLHAWCEANNVQGNPAKREAFQAEWLFVLVDFARRRIQDLRRNE